MPLLTGVGVAITVSLVAAPVTVTVPILSQLPRLTDGASKVAVPERCLVIVVPFPIFRLFALVVPFTDVVTPDLPIVSSEAFVVPIVIAAVPPVSIVKALAPFD